MTDKTPEEFYYVAFHSCGGWQGVMSNRYHGQEIITKFLAIWEGDGLTIERWPIEKFRKEAVSCKCLKKPKQKELITNAGA